MNHINAIVACYFTVYTPISSFNKLPSSIVCDLEGKADCDQNEQNIIIPPQKLCLGGI